MNTVADKNIVPTTTGANRLGALRRFAVTTTILSLLGHIVLGFEVSYATPLLALVVAYASAILLETCEARAHNRPAEFAGGAKSLVDFLLPYHIIALTCAMFLYPGDRLGPIAFATVLSVASRYLIRIPSASGSRHFLNPSNFGILATLICFPAVGIFMPIQFSSQVGLAADIALPVVLLGLGILLNAVYTKRLPLALAWLVAFIGQAVFRWAFADQQLLAMIGPATGASAMLYTFFMITDPGTTPSKLKPQLVFGAAIGIVYGALTMAHVVFGLFWALFLVSSGHGIYQAWSAQRESQSGGNASAVIHDLSIDRVIPDTQKLAG